MVLLTTAEKLNYFDIGKRITEARLAMGLTNMEMAAALNMSRENYSRAEHGTLVLKVEKMYLISQYLEVPLDYLLTGNIREDIDPRFVNLLAGRNKSELDKAYRILEILFEK